MRISINIACSMVAIWAMAGAGVWGSHERPASGRAPVRDDVTDLSYQRQYIRYGLITDTRLNELSGLVPSRRHSGVYWALTDSNNPATLYGLTDRGEFLGAWPVSGATNKDWEDITVNDAGQIVIADIGNNGRGKKDSRVLLMVDEPQNLKAPSPLQLRSDVRFRFHSDQHDCEALFAWKGEYYVIEKKDPDRKRAARRPTRLYRVPKPALGGAAPAQELRPYESFVFAAPVTSASLALHGRTLAVLTSESIYLFDRPDVDGPFFTRSPTIVPIECGQAESITFHHDGSGDLLVGTEDRMLFRITRAWYQSGRAYRRGVVMPASQPAAP